MEDSLGKSLLADAPSRLTRDRWLLLCLVFALALAIRWHGLDRDPKPHATSDEYHYIWAGLSLWHEGRPTAWSLLKAYDSLHAHLGKIMDQGTPLQIVSPALDHPPLFSLLAGGFTQLTGVEQVSVPTAEGGHLKIWRFSLGRARLLTLILFSFTFFLLFALSRDAFSYPVALLACLFYGVLAHAVLHNRLVVTENFTTPLFLVNLCALQQYARGRLSRMAFGWVTIITVAAALLSKLVAVSQAAVVIYFLVQLKRPRDLIFPVVGAVAGLALYLAYGWWQGWTAFTAVLGSQSGRFAGFDTAERLILIPRLVHELVISYPPVFIGWLAIFAQVLFSRRTTILAAPLIYLLASVFFAASKAVFGWHLLPFYPFLCLALAWWISRIYRRPDAPAFLVFVWLTLPYVMNSLAKGINFQHLTTLRYAYPVVVAALLLTSLMQGKTRTLICRLAVGVIGVQFLLIEVFRIVQRD